MTDFAHDISAFPGSPLQGAFALASANRSAGGQHASLRRPLRIPRFTLRGNDSGLQSDSLIIDPYIDLFARMSSFLIYTIAMDIIVIGEWRHS
jgi:hypothetical protein